MGQAREARSASRLTRGPRARRQGRRRGRDRSLASANEVLLIAPRLLGLACAIYTFVQATDVTDSLDPASYGVLDGVVTAPALVAVGVVAARSGGLAACLEPVSMTIR